MHPFSAFVVRNCDGTEGESVFGFDQAFDSVRDGVERVEDVEESWTRREGEISTERIDAPDGQKHTQRWSESIECRKVDCQALKTHLQINSRAQAKYSILVSVSNIESFNINMGSSLSLSSHTETYPLSAKTDNETRVSLSVYVYLEFRRITNTDHIYCSK